MLLSTLALLGLSSLAIAGPRTKPVLTVQTSSGRVTGFVNCTTPGVRQFLSIPFAEPPIGSRRFQPPVPLVGGPAIKSRSMPVSCMQSVPDLSNLGDTPFGPPFLIAGGVSEDCLYINVWTPAGAVAGSLPVIIWIYGGAFISGGSDVPYYMPQQWIQRTQSHIVVSFNYRLNAFGFPNARGQSLNVGLLDQRLAVEWVHANIAAFGGNPDRMVIWGQSAGASAVGLYNYAYYDNPLVYGAIADSGSPTMLLASDPDHAMFTKLAGELGCGNLSAAAELSCMQQVSATDIENAVLQFPTLFLPDADNVTAFADVSERAADGQLAKYPVLMGSNSNEGAAFGGTDVITCPVIGELENREEHGYATYRYYFAGNFSNITPDQAYGASHSTELPLVFGTAGDYNSKSTPFETQLSHLMEDLWLAYARNPNSPPTADGRVWPLYNSKTQSVVEFGGNNTVFQLVTASADTNAASCS